MHTELQEIVDELDAASVRLHDLQNRTSEDKWAQRSAAGRWSIGECVAHLNLTSAAYLPLLRAALDEARRSGHAVPKRFRRDVMGWLLWKSLGPPVKSKFKTPAPFVPRGDRPKADTVAEFERLQADVIALAREADSLPLQSVRVVSPFNSRVRYNLFSALAILARHQHRHFWQAEQNLT